MPVDPLQSSPVEPTTSTPPVFPGADVEAGLAEAVELAMSLDIAPLAAAYDAVMAHADAVCPPSITTIGPFGSWSAHCATADAGSVFSGTVSWYRIPSAYDSFALYASVITPVGSFSGSGNVSGSFDDLGDYVQEIHDFRGAFYYDGPEVAGTWLGDGAAPAVYVARAQAHGGGRSLFIDGAVSGLAAAVDTVDYGYVVWDSGCGEPDGVISTRIDGVYFDVTFGGDCDGCGEATWRGVPVGQACADFSPWTTLEVTP